MSSSTNQAVDRKQAYLLKLKDPRWQKKRLKILERDKWTCQICFDTKETLHVHHKKYSSGEPWESSDDDLVTLCASCHEVETEFLNEYLRILSGEVRKKFFSHDILDLAAAFSFTEIQNHPAGASFIGHLLKCQECQEHVSKHFLEAVKKNSADFYSRIETAHED